MSPREPHATDSHKSLRRSRGPGTSRCAARMGMVSAYATRLEAPFGAPDSHRK